MNGGLPGTRFTNVAFTATDSGGSIVTTAYPMAEVPSWTVTCAP